MPLNDPTPNTANSGDFEGDVPISDVNEGVTGVDLTAESQELLLPVRNTTDLVVAVREKSGGTVDVSVDFERTDGAVVSSLSPTDVLQGVTDGYAKLTTRGVMARVKVMNNTDATNTNVSVTTVP